MLGLSTALVIVILKQHFILNKKITYTKYLIPGLSLIIALFVVVSMRRDEAGLDVAISKILDYIFNNLHTFDKYVEPHAAYGDYSAYFGRYGDLILKPLFPYKGITLQTDAGHNTYTYLMAPYIYGGEALVYATFYVIGLFYAWLYAKVIKLNLYYMVFYSLFVFSILISFFAFAYSWTNWAYYIIGLVLIRWLVPQRSIDLMELRNYRYRN